MTEPIGTNIIQPPYPRMVPKLKGALVSVGTTPDQTTTVPFQYNPASIKRSVKPMTVGSGEGDRSAAVRFSGAATETISMTAQIDAIDGLDAGDADALQYGILPLLAALELFAYPSTSNVTKYQAQLASGSINVLPPQAPELVLVWGRERVLPVRLDSLAITEELFDGNLNPISASVALDMRVLTYSDTFPDEPAYNLFLSHQKAMEQLAKKVRPTSASTLIGVDPDSLDGS